MDPVYVDDALLVFDKPSGLLSVPGRGPDKQDCLAARAQARYPDALVVHRLDMDTSGLMVMARAVRKRYVAVVAGRPESPREGWGSIAMPLICDWPRRPRQIVDHVHGKP